MVYENPCLRKQVIVVEHFEKIPYSGARYEEIIIWGKKLPRFNEASRIDSNIIQGCQSLLYLETVYRDQKLFFNVDSSALISKGLAAILIFIYSGELASSIIETPPLFFNDLGLYHLLSVGRANGLSSLWSEMKRAAYLHFSSEKKRIDPA